MVGAGRIQQNAHFTSDVLAGSAIGWRSVEPSCIVTTRLHRAQLPWPEAPVWSSTTISERGEESIERCVDQ